MSVRKLFIIGISALLICALWGGCSKDNTANLGSRPAGSSSGAGLYFPTAEGYSTTYTVQHSNGDEETVRYTVGATVDIGGNPAVAWNEYSSAGTVNTSYFRATETAVDHYSGLGETPQRILELPFDLGHTWKSLVDVDDSYWPPYDSLSLGDDDQDYKDQPDSAEADDEGGLALSFPAIGSTYLTVQGFESLRLENGAYYSSALKVSSSNARGASSYFWYVAGVGLVKYVIDVTGPSDFEGRVVGELVYYGFK